MKLYHHIVVTHDERHLPLYVRVPFLFVSPSKAEEYVMEKYEGACATCINVIEEEKNESA